MSLDRHVAIVTGASRGIGRAVAGRLGREGAELVLSGRDPDKLDVAADELRTELGRRPVTVAVDSGDTAAGERLVEQAVDAFGRVDILVNNAASFRIGDVTTLTDDDWAHHLNVKFIGYARCIRAVVPEMKRHGWGRIVNVGGNAARLPTRSSAGPINAAIMNLTAVMARELAEWQITVNAVHPGATRTDRHRLNLEHGAEQRGVPLETIEEEMARKIPIGRIIEPEEVAAVVAFLVSEDAGAVTAQSITVDGGASPGVHY